MSDCILDASALLALVNQEPGQDMVAELLPRSLVSAVNASELVAKLTDQGMPEDEVQGVLAALALTVVSFDEGQGLVAGYLRPVTKHLGLSHDSAGFFHRPDASASRRTPDAPASSISGRRSARGDVPRKAWGRESNGAINLGYSEDHSGYRCALC